MKRFSVVIPEKRVEVVKVLYTIEAESEEQVRGLIMSLDFYDTAEYVETEPSPWGFDADEIYYDDAEITEVEYEKV